MEYLLINGVGSIRDIRHVAVGKKSINLLGDDKLAAGHQH